MPIEPRAKAGRFGPPSRERGCGANASGGRVCLRVGLLTLILLAPLATIGRAALWESPRWGLVGELGAAVGYDSNIYATPVRVADGFLAVAPTARLFRRHSLSALEFQAGAVRHNYFSQAAANSTDWRVQGLLVYPSDAESLFTQKAEFNWARATILDDDLRRRLREDRLRAAWDADVYDTGRAAFTLRMSYASSDPVKDEDAIEGVEKKTVGGTIDWKKNDFLRLGVGYDLALDDASGRRESAGPLRNLSHTVSLRGRGQFFPKVSGQAFVGVARVDYSGRFSLAGVKYVGGGDISWKATERFEASLHVERSSGISSDGQAVDRTGIEIGARHALIGGFGVGLYAAATADVYRGRSSRNDDGLRMGASLDYDLTGRLQASLRYDHDSRSSNLLTNYDRDRIVFRSGLRF